MKPNPNPNSREPRGDPRDPTAQQPLVSTPTKKVTLQPKAQGDEVNTCFFQFEKAFAERRQRQTNATQKMTQQIFYSISFQHIFFWFSLV